MPDRRILTTESGAPVADNQNSQTAGADGPVLLQDQHLIEKLARFNRERIPERIVHARGSGAHGHFEVTADVSQWTRARFLSGIGKRTEVFVRFSTVAGSRGAPEAVRDRSRFRGQVLHRRGRLRPDGKQHPDLLHPGPAQVPRFHPLPEARSLHEPPGAGQRVGLLLSFPGGDPHVHVALWRPGYSGELPEHERLRLRTPSSG